MLKLNYSEVWYAQLEKSNIIIFKIVTNKKMGSMGYSSIYLKTLHKQELPAWSQQFII